MPNAEEQDKRDQEPPRALEDIPAGDYIYVRSTTTGLVSPDPVPRTWLGTPLAEGFEEAEGESVRALLDAEPSPTATDPGGMEARRPATVTNYSAPRDVPIENPGPSTGDTAGEPAPVADAEPDEGHALGGTDPGAGAPRRGRRKAASGEPVESAGEAKSESSDEPAKTGKESLT
jgi:hypothetical protein